MDQSERGLSSFVKLIEQKYNIFVHSLKNKTRRSISKQGKNTDNSDTCILDDDDQENIFFNCSDSFLED